MTQPLDAELTLVQRLRTRSRVVFVAVDESPAQDLSNHFKEAADEIERLSAQVEKANKTLLLFRTFAINNATQWKMGTSHHHPIWALVAEQLGPMNEIEVRDGPDWQMVSPVSSAYQLTRHERALKK